MTARGPSVRVHFRDHEVRPFVVCSDANASHAVGCFDDINGFFAFLNKARRANSSRKSHRSSNFEMESAFILLMSRISKFDKRLEKYFEAF